MFQDVVNQVRVGVTSRVACRSCWNNFWWRSFLNSIDRLKPQIPTRTGNTRPIHTDAAQALFVYVMIQETRFYIFHYVNLKHKHV